MYANCQISFGMREGVVVSLLEVDATTALDGAGLSLDDDSSLVSGTPSVADGSSNVKLCDNHPGGGINSAVSKVIVESVMFSIWASKVQLSGAIVEIFVLTYNPCSAVNRYVLVKDVGGDLASPFPVL